ncbi:MAG TPA: hypothetical protein VG034_19190 [Acidimicrobiia bacterium]|jgi:Ca2+-binding RTX toxin-like protein|nr:hypothetical protein [Acidimicrobiia bacterium]
MGADANDTLRGGPGQDQLYGGTDGYDTLFGNDDAATAHDELDGGPETVAGPDNCFADGRDTMANCF